MLTTLSRLILMLFMLAAGISGGQAMAQRFSFEFYDGTFNFELDRSANVPYDDPLSSSSVQQFHQQLENSDYASLVTKLLDYREKNRLNDWIFYQLIRKTAQQISPKEKNYNRYTLYKWFLLAKSGYDARLGIGNDMLIFYVRNDEEVNDIPFFTEGNNKYMCLNIHDYGKTDLTKHAVSPVNARVKEAIRPFSYRVTRMPDFRPDTYTQKHVGFEYNQKQYHFQIKLNPEVEKIFANYPGVDFESYFNIPMSNVTYSSLIPALRRNVEKMSQKKGVDYLMRFTRYAFLYESDDINFGREKRLSAEQTLFSQYSDCDDRAALFFYLVKEIYNLPMIALLYPTHITMAVQFDRPTSGSVIYGGQKYSVCEATPQTEDLRVGQIASNFRNQKYDIVYVYDPVAK